MDLNNIIAQLQEQLDRTSAAGNFRDLEILPQGIDFLSNDYLGLAKKTSDYQDDFIKGAGGSRLISGNHLLYQEAESFIAKAHHQASALIFPSGYQTNLALLSTLPKKGDVILYDALCHASIRDGIQLSKARSYKFENNNILDLESKLEKHCPTADSVFVITESVFSMEGSVAPLKEIAELCEKYKAGLIIDEAHALGVFGLGKVSEMELQEKVLATVVTFSKGLGLHGGAVLGSETLIRYLVNYARPFIFTTGLPPFLVHEILENYKVLMKEGAGLRNQLFDNLEYFKTEVSKLPHLKLLASSTPIQSIIIPGNHPAKAAEKNLRAKGFLVKAVLHPTVAKDSERLRIIIHAFNSKRDIEGLIEALKGLKF